MEQTLAVQTLAVQIRVAAGMQRIRQRLALPGRLTGGGCAQQTFAEVLSERREWCATCRAEDVSGNHRRHGHAVVK